MCFKTNANDLPGNTGRIRLLGKVGKLWYVFIALCLSTCALATLLIQHDTALRMLVTKTLQAVPGLGAVITPSSSAALSWHCRVCRSSPASPCHRIGLSCGFYSDALPSPLQLWHRVALIRAPLPRPAVLGQSESFGKTLL